MKKIMLSIVIQAYNDAQNIENSVREIKQQIEKTRFFNAFEIIVVDDHSTDNTYEVCSSFKGPHFQCLRLSRNSGSHTAVRTGSIFVQGEAVIVISADGLCNPVAIHEMLKKWEQSSHVVWAVRKSRKNEPLFYRSQKANMTFSADPMCADLQNPPELIGQMFKRCKTGSDIVWSVRRTYNPGVPAIITGG